MEVKTCLTVTSAVDSVGYWIVPGAALLKVTSVITFATTSVTCTRLDPSTVSAAVTAPGWSCSLTDVVPEVLPRTRFCRSRPLSLDEGAARNSAIEGSSTTSPVAQLVTSSPSA